MIGVHKCIRAFNSLARRVAARSGLLSSFYFMVTSATFRREHRAVLAGLVRFERFQKPGEGNVYVLRRCIHRLEKGLLMRPRADVFAVGYIRLAVDAYARALRDRGKDGVTECAAEMRWADDVLSEYFRSVSSHPVIDAAREEFTTLVLEKNGEDPMIPQKQIAGGDLSVGYEDMLAIAKHRSSVRWFKQEPVPRSAIDRALNIARLSPSACNRQPTAFRILDDPQLVERAAELSIGMSGYAGNVPVLAVVIGDLGAFGSERDRHLIYVDSSLAAMSFVYGLETQGLASCCINWPGIAWRDREMADLLGLKAHEKPIMMVALGYPDPSGHVANSQRKELTELRSYNSE